MPITRSELLTEPLWERQETESDEDWARFVAYRDMPAPRKLHRPGVGRHEAQQRPATRWRWQERIKAYDLHVECERQAKTRRILEETYEQKAAGWAAINADVREIAAIEVSRLLEMVKESNLPGNVKLADLTRLIELTFKHERLLAEKATSIAGTPQELGDYSHMSATEIEQATKMLEKLLGPTKH